MKIGAGVGSGAGELVGEGEEIDAAEWQARYRSEELPECPLEIVASEADNAMGTRYFVERRDELAELLASREETRRGHRHLPIQRGGEVPHAPIARVDLAMEHCTARKSSPPAAAGRDI